MGGDDRLGPCLHKVMKQYHQAKGGGKRQWRVGLVHEVEPRVRSISRKPSPWLSSWNRSWRWPGLFFQVGVETVHGVRAQEISPVGPDGPALDNQLSAQSGLAVASLE
jgi:hypothetical protein